MEPLYFKSEEALYFYLKRFLKSKPKAKRLGSSGEDGSKPSVALVFEYSVDGSQYKIMSDTSRSALEKFVEITEEQGNPSLALRGYNDATHGPILILGHQKKPTPGWHCLPFVAKASDQMKKAA